jgi:hypothetical protein
MSFNKILSFFSLLFISLSCTSCVIWPVTDHWNAQMKNGKLEVLRARCSAGADSGGDLENGYFHLSRDRKNKQLKWHIRRGAFRSIIVPNEPIVFKFKSGERVEVRPDFTLTYAKIRPEDQYSWKDGYKIQRDKNSDQVTIEKYEIKKSTFLGDRRRLLERFTIDNSSISEPIVLGSLQYLSEKKVKEGRSVTGIYAEGVIPLIDADVEIEVPPYTVDRKVYPRQTIYYKYFTRWEFFVFNC